MATKAKHKSRSRKTAKKRLAAARHYLNYSLTKEARKMFNQMARY